MLLTSLSLLLATASTFTAVVAGGSSSHGSKGLDVTFSKGQIFQFDTDGNNIALSNDKIDFLGGSYVWYGNSFQTDDSVFGGIGVYTSNDLKNWVNRGFLFDPNTPAIQAMCTAPFSGNCGRPGILYNAATSTYVLYVNSGSPGYAVFTSKSATSGYVYSGRSILPVQPPGTQGGDLSLSMVDGKAYLVYSLIDFKTLNVVDSLYPPFKQTANIVQLSDNYLNTTGPVYPVSSAANDLTDNENESPDLFKRGAYYYVVTSSTCGFCDFSPFIAYRSKSLSGPWTRQIVSGDTCRSQLAGIIPLPSGCKPSDESFLLLSDAHSSAPDELFGVRTSAHGHFQQTLQFNKDGSIAPLDCSGKGSYSLNIVPGTGPAPTGRALSATVSSGNFGNYALQCDLPRQVLVQSFIAPKAGRLTDVSVNVAETGADGPLTVTVLRFGSNAQLQAPFYKYEPLMNSTFTPAQLGKGGIGNDGQVVVSSSSTTVAKGDHIGILLTTTSTVPICTFRQFSGAPSGTALFQEGFNVVSLRGPQANQSPVVLQSGQSLKFLANIA